MLQPPVPLLYLEVEKKNSKHQGKLLGQIDTFRLIWPSLQNITQYYIMYNINFYLLSIFSSIAHLVVIQYYKYNNFIQTCYLQICRHQLQLAEAYIVLANYLYVNINIHFY